MTMQTISVGSTSNDGTGDQLRTALQKVNANFLELYNGNGPGNITINSAVISGNVTVGGNVTMSGLQRYNVNTIANVGVTRGNVNCALGNYFKANVAYGNVNFSFLNPPVTGVASRITLEITHCNGNISFDTAMKWSANATPTFYVGSNAAPRVHIVDAITSNGGTTWLGIASPNISV